MVFCRYLYSFIAHPGPHLILTEDNQASQNIFCQSSILFHLFMLFAKLKHPNIIPKSTHVLLNIFCPSSVFFYLFNHIVSMYYTISQTKYCLRIHIVLWLNQLVQYTWIHYPRVSCMVFTSYIFLFLIIYSHRACCVSWGYQVCRQGIARRIHVVLYLKHVLKIEGKRIHHH